MCNEAGEFCIVDRIQLDMLEARPFDVVLMLVLRCLN